ncbi:MAG: hypothetical protein JSR24_00190 [Proteobacteria bacterium]|nr:hypothetical protein [Pseudomonadota bacterium]
MSNEGKACDAIIRLLEERAGKVRANVRRSEVTNGLPPVELDFDIGDQHVAVEHTLLQTFAQQIGSAKQFYELALEVVSSLSGQLPKPGVYKLYFPTFSTVGRSMTMDMARNALREWVIATAGQLHASHPERRAKNVEPFGHEASITGAPTGLPFEITLWRELHWSLAGRFDGVLTLGRFGPENLEEQRVTQMTRALTNKCPKLQKFKQAGAWTVLILEDADISLSNHVTVADAFEAACVGREDLPDEVFLIDTKTDPWTVWKLKDGDKIELSEKYWEYAEAALDDVTSE